MSSSRACCCINFQRSRTTLTLGLLAVSQVGSTARLVTVPAVITRGKMAPYISSALYLSDLPQETFITLYTDVTRTEEIQGSDMLKIY